MKVIISPAKKIIDASDDFSPETTSIYISETNKLYEYLCGKELSELKALWNCSDKLAKESYMMLQQHPDKGITPAVHSYSGLAYQHLASSVMTNDELSWIKEHLRILSGYHGVLRPYDAIVPYRLEMQTKIKLGEYRSLYEFWGSKLYEALNDHVIVNLASDEYSKSIEPYITNEDKFITFVFAHEEKGKLVQKGTYAKAARGEMVRFMAENQIINPEECKEFKGDYVYSETASTDEKYVFIHQGYSRLKKHLF